MEGLRARLVPPVPDAGSISRNAADSAIGESGHALIVIVFAQPAAQNEVGDLRGRLREGFFVVDLSAINKDIARVVNRPGGEGVDGVPVVGRGELS